MLQDRAHGESGMRCLCSFVTSSSSFGAGVARVSTVGPCCRLFRHMCTWLNPLASVIYCRWCKQNSVRCMCFQRYLTQTECHTRGCFTGVACVNPAPTPLLLLPAPCTCACVNVLGQQHSQADMGLVCYTPVSDASNVSLP